MLYGIFYYMVFTRYSAGKIWSSICILKAELHYQINLIRLINNSFLYQICLTEINLMEIIIYMFRTHRRIKKQVKRIRWSFCEYSYRRKPVNYFYRKLYLRSFTGVLNAPPEYLKLNVIQKLNLPFKQWYKDM